MKKLSLVAGHCPPCKTKTNKKSVDEEHGSGVVLFLNAVLDPVHDIYFLGEGLQILKVFRESFYQDV